MCVPPLLVPNSSIFSSSGFPLFSDLTTASLYICTFGGIAQHIENHEALPNFGKMLEYS